MTQMSETLRTRLRNLIGSEHRQLLSDYDVDPALLDNDPDHGMSLDALIDTVVHSVRLFDDQGRAYEAALAENERLREAANTLTNALDTYALAKRTASDTSSPDDYEFVLECWEQVEAARTAPADTGGNSDE